MRPDDSLFVAGVVFVLGILIAVLMIFRPQGILGNKREVQFDG